MRRRLAIALLLLTLIVYPICWEADPYIFGLAVLVGAPAQLTVAGIGVLARVFRLDPVRTLLSWSVDALLIGAAVGALAFLRTISWS